MCAVFACRRVRPFDLLFLPATVLLHVLFTRQPVREHFHLIFDHLFYDFRVTFTIRVHGFVFDSAPFRVSLPRQFLLERELLSLVRFVV